jgi:FHS family L-fucose permease-like MFS transporter
MAVFKKIFKKNSLKISDKERTKAAELTLKESIYPLCLVTVLFFLWVSSLLATRAFD